MGKTGSTVGTLGGAALGTVVGGPLGTAIGGTLGGAIGGMFDGSDASNSPKPLQGVDETQIGAAAGHVNTGLAQQQAFVNAVNAQNGLGNQTQVYNQLQGIANGTGPNPAQAALNQATGNNVAQQAALMASQRGVGANPGLIARQAAMQGANIQQNAAGQAATLQAQQQMAAINAAGGLANQQAAQQQQALGQYNQFAQGQQQNLLNAAGQYNNVNAGIYGTDTAAATAAAGRNQEMNKGLASGLGAAATALGGSSGSGSSTPAIGGFPSLASAPTMVAAHGGEIPASRAGQHLKGLYAQGGEVAPAPSVSVGPKLKAGGPVPGKAKVKGDSLKNDTVAAQLSPGEAVIPRSVMQSKNPGAEAAKFVEAILAKQGPKRK